MTDTDSSGVSRGPRVSLEEYVVDTAPPGWRNTVATEPSTPVSLKVARAATSDGVPSISQANEIG
jgi:hypothetical protein